MLYLRLQDGRELWLRCEEVEYLERPRVLVGDTAKGTLVHLRAGEVLHAVADGEDLARWIREGGNPPESAL